jgi:two-component system chemotaxis response regulator CheY
MLVVVKSAEEILLKELKVRAFNDPTSRCLYWRASLLGEKREQCLPLFLSTLDNILLSDPGQAYICHDGDVFVIARTLTNKILSSLQTHMTQKLGLASFGGLADLFEIGIDAERLITLGRTKLENRKIFEQKKLEKKKEELLPIEREKALQEISEQMISTLSKRRAARDEPEIMIVEDDAFSQKLVCNTLGNKYTVSVSGDGQGAIMAYVTKAPDVLFLDIGLPDMDGHAVLERIFKMDPQAYVVMFSGNGNKENIMRALELGAKGFVGKPFTKEKLFQYIEKSPFIQSRQKHGAFA